MDINEAKSRISQAEKLRCAAARMRMVARLLQQKDEGAHMSVEGAKIGRAFVNLPELSGETRTEISLALEANATSNEAEARDLLASLNVED